MGCWSLGFVAGRFVDGRRMRSLVLADDCTRECLALVGDTSICGVRVARELDRFTALVRSHRSKATGRPCTRVSYRKSKSCIMLLGQETWNNSQVLIELLRTNQGNKGIEDE
jgi:hypothetical protein